MPKTRSDILGQVYLTRKDIKDLLKVSYPKAREIYNRAMDIDIRELSFHPWDTRVRIQSALKVAGVTFAQLEKQIKSAAS